MTSRIMASMIGGGAAVSDWARRHWRLLVDLALSATLVTVFAVSGAVVSVPLAAAQLAPLAVRRRAPGLALVVIGAATAAHSLLGMARAVGYLPLALALYTAATHRSRALRWWLCGAVVAVATTAGAVRHGAVEGGLLAGVAFVITWLAGYERGEHQHERTEHAAESARLLMEKCLSEQHEQLARRLHDSLAHTMTVMLVQAEALRSTATLAPADRDRLDAVLLAGRGALAEVRTALADQDHSDATGVLTERLTATRAAGLRVSASLPDELTNLPTASREVLSRLVAEAATNALRHDGPGTRLTATLRHEGGRCTLRLTSVAGRERLTRTSGGFGLRSLTTNIAEVGGTLTYGPDPAGHWQIIATVPA
jgi:signal transduction histidine kinase